MKRILTGLIGGVALAALALGTAIASEHYEGYEGGHEAYEHGGYYNNGYTNYGYTNYGYPSGGYYGYGYDNDDMYKHRNRYYNTGAVYPNTNVYGNVGYRNHEMYEYGR